MQRIDQHKNIYLSRGDDFSFVSPVYVDDSKTAYHFEANDGCMLFFYIFLPNSVNYEFILKKTFQTDGDIVTEIVDEYEPQVTTGNTNINEFGNIIIRLTPEDTMSIRPGQYKYQIRVKVLNGDNELVLKTVTNRKDFYVIEDDYSDRVW